MGMFDWVICEVDLPGPNTEDGMFQTKSLDCLMYTYIIKRDLTIWREDRIAEDPESYLSNVLDPNSKYSYEYKTVSGQLHDMHGDIIFYSLSRKDNDEQVWIEYKARFTNGKLDEIILLEPRD